MKFATFEKLKSSDKKSAMHRILEDGYPDADFYFMNILAASITSLGIILDSVTIIIGGMILAPMLFPIFSLALSIEVSNLKVLLRSLLTLSVSILMNISVAFIFTFLFSSYLADVETNAFLSGLEFQFPLVLVGLIAGMAATFSTTQHDHGNVIAAVAVSTALLPPLVSVGIGISLQNQEILVNSGLILLSNIVSILIGSYIIFLLNDFSQVRKSVESVDVEG